MPTDLPVLDALNRAEVPAVGAITMADLEHLVDASTATLVAEVDGDVAAFLLALGPGLDYASPNYRFFAEAYGDFAYVDRVVVGPAHRRRGLGAALYDELEATVGRAAGRIACEVNVRPRNEASLAFHAARGFVPVGEQDTDGGAKRVRLLVRELDPG